MLRLFRLAVQELHTWEVYQGTNRGVISDWKPFVDFVICLSFCFVIYVSFYLGIFSSVSRIVFLNLLLFMHFCFILCIHLLVTSFQVCIYVWLYSWKSVFIHMFFHMFIVVFIHLLNQFMIVLGNDLFFIDVLSLFSMAFIVSCNTLFYVFIWSFSLEHASNLYIDLSFLLVYLLKGFFCSFMHLFFGIPVSNRTKQ